MSIFKGILTIVFGAFIFSLPLVFVGNTNHIAHLELEKNSSKSFDFIVIGDSRCHTGISPKHISEELYRFSNKSVNGYNYCVDGTDAMHHASLVSNGILNQLKGAKVVIWAIHPLQFDQTRVNNRLEWLRTSDIVPLVQAGAPKELILDLITGSVFPQWRHRPMFFNLKSDYMERAAIRTLPLQEKLLGLTADKDADSRKYFQNDDGFEPFQTLKWEKRFSQGTDAYVVDYNKLVIDEWRLNLIKNVSDKVKSIGGTLVLVQMPTTEIYREKFSSQSKYKHWQSLVEVLSAKEKITYLNHAPLTLSNDSGFGDPAHMAMDAAIDYSRYIARSLSELVFMGTNNSAEADSILMGEI